LGKNWILLIIPIYAKVSITNMNKLNLKIIAPTGLRLGLKNRQVGEKWVSDDCSYLCKGLYTVARML
jgi:hypothetical protein